GPDGLLTRLTVINKGPQAAFALGRTVMKDVTATSFGLLIGFLLPGLMAFYSLGAWIPAVRDLLSFFRGAKSDIGLFLLVLLVALTVGLLVSAFRWLLLEVKDRGGDDNA